ncbi:YhfG family protein [Alcanivorax sp.]
MPVPSLESKKAYFARVRRANYAASLRLEGFTVKDGDVVITPKFSPAQK